MLDVGISEPGCNDAAHADGGSDDGPDAILRRAHVVENVLYIRLARTLRGSLGLICKQRCHASNRAAAMLVEMSVSSAVSRRRGGKDFFSGMPGESITLTTGTSFAS